MVTDFKHLGWLKNFIDNNVDHKFIVDKNDPLFHSMLGRDLDLTPVLVPETDFVAGHVVNLDLMADVRPGTPEYEYLEGFFVVDFTPTSENLCKWLFDVASVKMARLGVKVARVDWWETPKSRSSYSGE
jgi:6-pyruvoyltetrahydropterin/6-carboxytetrahydropterin synthase